MFFRMSQGQKCKGIQRVKISMDVCNKPLNSCWVCPQYENINVLLIFLELVPLKAYTLLEILNAFLMENTNLGGHGNVSITIVFVVLWV